MINAYLSGTVLSILGLHAASGTLYSLFVLQSLHVPAGACISVASASPIHVPPVRVLKHCGVHKHNIIYIYIYTCARDPKQS